MPQYCFCFMFWSFGYETCGILAAWPGWSNPHLPHWKMKSQPPDCQESPPGWTFDVSKSRILRREGHPGLSGWTLSMITRVPIGGRQRSIWHGEGGGTDVKRSGVGETGTVLWSWRKGPLAEECRQPLEAGKGKEMDSPLETRVGGGMALLTSW